MPTLTAEQLARQAGLRYIGERPAGITRQRRGSGFTYHGPRGVAVDRHLPRIRSLAIPPAWQEVWICADPKGHLQATGRDARGRLQYRYHPDWCAAGGEAKFQRIAALARELPKIRRQVRRDLAQDGLPRTRVLAAVVALLEDSFIRVGNTEYARDNGSFGLTTLRKRHVKTVPGRGLKFSFVGKGSIAHEVEIASSAVGAVIRACRELPGRDLFQYRDDKDVIRDITANDVNAYLSALAEVPTTAKDFRTWGGTVLMYRALLRTPPGASKRENARLVKAALAEVAEALGNTVAVCRKAYVYPGLVPQWERGALPPVRSRGQPFGTGRLSALEQATLKVLSRRLKPPGGG